MMEKKIFELYVYIVNGTVCHKKDFDNEEDAEKYGKSIVKDQFDSWNLYYKGEFYKQQYFGQKLWVANYIKMPKNKINRFKLLDV